MYPPLKSSLGESSLTCAHAHLRTCVRAYVRAYVRTYVRTDNVPTHQVISLNQKMRNALTEWQDTHVTAH